MQSDPSISSRGTYSITVDSLPLSARVSGATQVSNLESFVLDGSTSKDLDLADGLADEGLSFSWRCTLIDGKTTDVCRDNTGGELALTNTPSITVAAGKLLATGTNPYVFTLTVSKGSKAPSAFSVPVTVLNRFVPKVTITIMSIHRVKSDGSTQINAGDKLILEGA